MALYDCINLFTHLHIGVELSVKCLDQGHVEMFSAWV